MRPNHKMRPLMDRTFSPERKVCLNDFCTTHNPQFSFLSSFLILKCRVNKHRVMPQYIQPKTEAKLLWENIWPLWFCKTFQNTEFTDKRREKPPIHWNTAEECYSIRTSNWSISCRAIMRQFFFFFFKVLCGS